MSAAEVEAEILGKGPLGVVWRVYTLDDGSVVAAGYLRGGLLGTRLGHAAVYNVQSGRHDTLTAAEAAEAVATCPPDWPLHPECEAAIEAISNPAGDAGAELEADGSDAERRITLTPASAIAVRPVHWLWEGRLPLGSVALLAGREGIGKSTAAYTLAADVTRGRLAGRFHGQPKSVIVAATEDSWSHTIVPRLMAADADLDRVYRVEVTIADGFPGNLTLPEDIDALAEQIDAVDAALVLLDPLISRLDGRLDTHRDAEVRRGLEPLARLADQTGTVVWGLIHLNKGGSTDPLATVMGSRAFVAVARSVLYAVADPDDDGARLLGLAKNNLGRLDLPTLRYRIAGCVVADTDEGPVWTGRLVWDGETERSISDALEASAAPGGKSAVDEAAAWLEDYLVEQGGGADSAGVKAAAKAAGHARATLERAAKRLKVSIDQHGFPRRTYWTLPADRGAADEQGDAA